VEDAAESLVVSTKEKQQSLGRVFFLLTEIRS
jgi:hypothetical protein